MDVVFAAAAAERRRVAALLDELSAEQLDTPSLCAEWSVREVGAHLAAAVMPSQGAFVGAVVRARGNLHRANVALARQVAERPASELAELLRENADQRFSPPVVGPRGPLTDVLVHAGDMRLPLGLEHTAAPEHVRHALEFVTQGRPFGFVPRGRLDDLHLVADDADWSWGAGETVTGRGLDLVMAACGRRAVLDSLSGDGVEVLAPRLAA